MGEEPDRPVGPWGGPPSDRREPALKISWPPALLIAALIVVFLWQLSAPDFNRVTVAYGFTPLEAEHGAWWTIFTALFVHGSWSHVLVNSAFLLAFGSPLARRFGVGPWGALLFFLFFLICGLAGNLGYALAHSNGAGPVVGASGGIAGFVAGASRLLVRRPGETALAPLTSPPVVTMAASLITLNVMVGLLHIGAGLGSDNAPIAWEAHVAGYLAGLALMGPFDALAQAGAIRLQSRSD